MRIETNFGMGDRVVYAGGGSASHGKKPGDTGTVVGIHAHAGQGGIGVSYSVEIDAEFVPRLEAEGCEVRTFHVNEGELTPVSKLTDP